jgi:hypothetical protein
VKEAFCGQRGSIPFHLQFFVFYKFLVSSCNEFFMRSKTNSRAINFVDKLLKEDRVSVGCLYFIRIAESNIFKPMDFTVGIEEIV